MYLFYFHTKHKLILFDQSQDTIYFLISLAETAKRDSFHSHFTLKYK